MASRLVAPALRASSRPSTLLSTPIARRTFHASARPLDTLAGPAVAPPMPIRRPVGAFRGALFGGLLGATLTAYGMGAYALNEWRASNDMLHEDIYALQAAVQKLDSYVSRLEEKVDLIQQKRP